MSLFRKYLEYFSTSGGLFPVCIFVPKVLLVLFLINIFQVIKYSHHYYRGALDSVDMCLLRSMF